ncbi:MAG: cyclic nucleotide-binding domain-containing protein, partial [Rhodocyclaceae bacterium]|nr:cyclic nucleotide-binding domain-containing protein [Rhodocyclaceae bacterium]
MIQPLADILDRCELFASVDRSALSAELASADIKALGAGEVLLDPLRQNDVVYILLEGQLLVCLEPKPGNPLVTLKPGDCVGELSIIDTRPPSAYVVAAAPCRLLAITRELMWRMVAGQPAVGANLLRILADRIRQNNAIILSSLELQRHYRNKAEYDALTGLRNRAWLDEIFPKQLELCERIGQRVSLVIL